MIILNENQDQKSKLNLLQYAIENKYEIVFWYRGKKVSDPRNKKYFRQNWRFAQPVALGYSKASGGLMLRAWQKKGVTNTVRPAWKTFLVDEMKNIVVHDGENGKYYRPFAKPEGYNYNEFGDLKMNNIFSQIKLDQPPGENKNKKPEEPTDEPKTNIDVVKAPEPNIQTTQKQPVIKNNSKELSSDEIINQDKINLNKIKANLDSYDEIEESYSSGFLKWVKKIYG